MSLQRLGPRKVRKLSEATGLPVLGGWAGGGYAYWFVTVDHEHGWFDLKTGEFALDPTLPCVSSCRDRFPNQPPATPQEQE